MSASDFNSAPERRLGSGLPDFTGDEKFRHRCLDVLGDVHLRNYDEFVWFMTDMGKDDMARHIVESILEKHAQSPHDAQLLAEYVSNALNRARQDFLPLYDADGEEPSEEEGARVVEAANEKLYAVVVDVVQIITGLEEKRNPISPGARHLAL